MSFNCVWLSSRKSLYFFLKALQGTHLTTVGIVSQVCDATTLNITFTMSQTVLQQYLIHMPTALKYSHFQQLGCITLLILLCSRICHHLGIKYIKKSKVTLIAL